MEMAQVVEIGRDLLYTALLLALPALAVSLVIGLIVGVLQAITSIQEQTLSFVPRLLAVGLVMVLALPWTMQLAVHFTMRMLERAAGVGR
jgi:flagellar biosynthetic protein FliQ